MCFWKDVKICQVTPRAFQPRPPCTLSCMLWEHLEGEHTILRLISPQQPQAPSMETWIKGSVWWLFTFPSLFLRHQVAKAFITSAAAAAPLSWWGGMDPHQNKEEAIIKDGGTMSRPLPGSSPVWEHDAPLLRFCVTFLTTQTASRHSLRVPSVLQWMSTNMLWRIMFTAWGESFSHKPKKNS